MPQRRMFGRYPVRDSFVFSDRDEGLHLLLGSRSGFNHPVDFAALYNAEGKLFSALWETPGEGFLMYSSYANRSGHVKPVAEGELDLSDPQEYQLEMMDLAESMSHGTCYGGKRFQPIEKAVVEAMRLKAGTGWYGAREAPLGIPKSLDLAKIRYIE